MASIIRTFIILITAVLMICCTHDDSQSLNTAQTNSKVSISILKTATKVSDGIIPYDAQINRLTFLVFDASDLLVRVVHCVDSDISVINSTSYYDYEVTAGLSMPEGFNPETYTILAYANVSNDHFTHVGITDVDNQIRPNVDISFTERLITLRTAKQIADAGELIPMYGVLQAEANETGGFIIGGLLRRSMARINLKLADSGVTVTGSPPTGLGDFVMHRAYLYFASEHGNITHVPDHYGQYVLTIPDKVKILTGEDDKEHVPQTLNFTDGITNFAPIYTYEYDARYFTSVPMLYLEASFTGEIDKVYSYMLSLEDANSKQGISIFRNTEYNVEITHVPYPDQLTPPVVPISVLYKIVIKKWVEHEIPLPDYW